jgi:itaconyl-CoA hydratase
MEENAFISYRRIGDNRYRETQGLYFEDFSIGDVFEHRPGRTLTQADNIWFTLLTMNTQPLHFDEAYAAQTEWKRCLIDSTLTLAILTGMSVKTLTGHVVANLGWDHVRLTHPLFAGDTLYAESTILAKRLSRSRPGQGIVTAETRGVNQDGKVACTFERTFLVYERASAPAADRY